MTMRCKTGGASYERHERELCHAVSVLSYAVQQFTKGEAGGGAEKMRSTVEKRDSNGFVASARCYTYTDSTVACIVTCVFTELEIRQFDSAFVKSSS